MVLYLDSINKNILTFYDDDKKKYDIDATNIDKKFREGNIYTTENFKDFTYSEGLTENKKNEILELQKKLFNR